MSTISQRIEQALAFVRNMRKSDGTTLFTGVGFPIPSGVYAFPYALMMIDLTGIHWEVLIKYDIDAIISILDQLSITDISHTGPPKYERGEDGEIYARIPFTIALPMEKKNE